ncbi:MAG: hypothetical protein INF52_01645 [Rhodobacter sp.]|nr:hypothetical protein [Rhodobacter sp.]
MVGDDVILLRMVWHPADFEGGELVGSAFESADLRPDNDQDGLPRYLSSDRQDDLRKESIDSRITYQQRDGRDVEKRKSEAHFVEFKVGTLRYAEDDAGDRPFGITSEPIIPENPGHCAIRNVSGKGASRKSKADKQYIEELRSMLLEKKLAVCGYADLFPVP